MTCLNRKYTKPENGYTFTWSVILVSEIEKELIKYHDLCKRQPNVRLEAGPLIYSSLTGSVLFSHITDSLYVFSLDIPLQINWSLDKDEIQYIFDEEIQF